MNVSFLLIAPALFLFSTQTLLSQSTLCSPPSSKAFTSFNNVRALVENNGSMWQDRNMNRASYEVPTEGGVSCFYAGSLWLGGLSQSGQLSVAANTFAQGTDFYPGPLTQNSIEPNPQMCAAHDEIFRIQRAEVSHH